MDATDSTQNGEVWLIEPSAAPDDSWWQGRPIWQLAIAAPSAAFARLEAERWARRSLPAVPVGNESLALNAGFIDHRLYRVRALARDEGPRPEEFAGSTIMVLAGPLESAARA